MFAVRKIWTTFLIASPGRVQAGKKWSELQRCESNAFILGSQAFLTSLLCFITQNVRKITSNATYILEADTCRRFLYGTTIEGEDTRCVVAGPELHILTCSRFWFFFSFPYTGLRTVQSQRGAHSKCLRLPHSVHDPFPKDVEYLIRYVISLAFSNDEELGFDPTVTPEWNEGDNSICYIYEVKERHFKTIKALGTSRLGMIVTRASRVWKVVELNPDGTESGNIFALKDTWIDINDRTEEQVLSSISSKICTVHDMFIPEDQATPEAFALHFPTVEISEVVPTCFAHGGHAKGEDYSSIIYTRGNFLPEGPLKGLILPESVYYLRSVGASHVSGYQQSLSTSAIPQPHVFATRQEIYAEAKRKHFGQKKHFRIVFQEVGKDLHLESIGQAYGALCDAILGEAQWFRVSSARFICL